MKESSDYIICYGRTSAFLKMCMDGRSCSDCILRKEGYKSLTNHRVIQLKLGRVLILGEESYDK